jgi:hypothetical protein
MMNQIKNQWRKAFGNQSQEGNQHQYRGSNAKQGQSQGDCQYNQ